MENELFEHGPIHKAYFKFALPVVFGMVVSLISIIRQQVHFDISRKLNYRCSSIQASMAIIS